MAAGFSTTFIILRSGSTLFYFKYVVGADTTAVLFGTFDQATVFLSSNALCQMIGAACLGLVTRSAEKRKLAVALTLVTAVCYGSFYFLPTDNFGLLLTVNALGSLAMGPTSALVWAMYGDVADFGEWKFGRRATGLVYSASLFALKTGSMVAGVLLPHFLGQFGFVRDVAQTQTAILVGRSYKAPRSQPALGDRGLPFGSCLFGSPVPASRERVTLTPRSIWPKD